MSWCGRSQETKEAGGRLAVVWETGVQGLYWRREAAEMHKVGHMGEIKKKN